jgi:2-dehydropantoate 2-reductase
MKIAIMGSGSIGGYLGIQLARAGNDVHFIARGPTLAALEKNGFRLITSNEDVTVHVKASEQPKDAGTVDLALFCVKTYDTQSAAAAILPILRADSCVLTLQNGIENFEQIGAIVGRNRVLPGVMLISSEVSSPGVVRVYTQIRKILLGENGGERSPRVDKIHEVFKAAGLDSEVTEEIQKLLWQKMVWICGLAGVTAITRISIDRILADQVTRDLFRDTMEEALTVAKAGGVDLGKEYVESQIEFAGRLEKGVTSSMARDLQAGKKLELEALNGAIARIGNQRGVPTPLNRTIHAALKPYENGLGQ